MMRTLALAACTLTLALACQTAGETKAVEVTPEQGPPPPFTAEEIMLGNPPGTERTFELVGSEGPAQLQTVRFVEGPEDTRAFMQFLTQVVGSDAEPAASEASATWAELRLHASFPPEKTTRVPAEWTTKAGSFDGWLYVVEDEVDGVPVITRYWFAHDEPGQPVMFETEIDGETALRTELVESRRTN